MKKLILSAIIGSLFISGAAFADGWSSNANNNIPGDDYWSSTDNTPKDGQATYGLSSIYADSIDQKVKDQKSSISSIRSDAIQSAALSFGMQAGFAKESQEINDQLNKNGAYYDKIFDFGKIEIEDGLLPPVISEGIDAYNQPNDNEVRASDKLYRIEFPAKIVNTPPTWRDYLLIPFSDAQTPDETVLPKNNAEKELWDHYAVQGWSQGVQQARDVLDDNTGRLKRDFEGMIRYKKLYEQGLVTKPIVARSELGVTGGGNEMAIGDRLIQLTQKSELNPDSKKWSTKDPK